MTLNDLLIDKRIVQRNIEQGKLDSAQYQKLLDALPDLSDKVWRRSESGSGSQSGGNVVKRPVLHSASVQQPPDHLRASAAFDRPLEGQDMLESDELDDADDDLASDDELGDDDELASDELPEELPQELPEAQDADLVDAALRDAAPRHE